MMRAKVAGLAGFGLLLAAVILFTLPHAAGQEAWGCSSDRLALDTFQVEPSGGYKTPDGAVLAEADLLASDNVASPEDLKAAASSSTGDSHFDAETGNLYVNGSLLARISLAQLSDKSWTINQAMYCSAIPEKPGEQGTTPEASQ